MCAYDPTKEEIKLIIPEGEVFHVDGDLDARGFNLVADGDLYVEGDVRAASITATTGCICAGAALYALAEKSFPSRQDFTRPNMTSCSE